MKNMTGSRYQENNKAFPDFSKFADLEAVPHSKWLLLLSHFSREELGMVLIGVICLSIGTEWIAAIGIVAITLICLDSIFRWWINNGKTRSKRRSRTPQSENEPGDPATN